MYAINIVIDQIIDALGDFIQPFVNGVDIIRGQTNRVPPPSGQFVELTEILSVDLAIPYQTYFDDTENPDNSVANLVGRVRSDIQVDFFGDDSGNWCRAIQNAIRTTYGFSAFPDNIKPLYCTDGFQHPWMTGEQQSLNRWTLTVSIQYNPQVAVPQQFAVEAAATIYPPVDA